MEEAFGVPLPDHYAVGECLLLSNGCQKSDGAHINADWVILEVVDEEYRPVPPGTLGAKLLVTNLANRVQPFIRYEVPDRAAVSIDPCPCGSRLPRITQIEGRTAEIFWVDDGIRQQFLSGVLFHSAADSLGDVREWQAIQHERNRVEIRLELLPGSSRSSAMAEVVLRQRLQDSGLPRAVAIDVKVVPSLSPRSEDGQIPPHVEHNRRAGKRAELTHPVKADTLVRETCQLPVSTRRAAVNRTGGEDPSHTGGLAPKCRIPGHENGESASAFS